MSKILKNPKECAVQSQSAPFVLTIPTWRSGTVRVEMNDWQLIQLAEKIAKALEDKRVSAAGYVRRLRERVESATKPAE